MRPQSLQAKLIYPTAETVHNEYRGLIYLAARTCYSEKKPQAIWDDYINEKIPPDKALRLIEHVIESGHHSTIEHINFTFAISGVTRSLTHQLVRHRIGIAFDQQSQRYVVIGGKPLCEENEPKNDRQKRKFGAPPTEADKSAIASAFRKGITLRFLARQYGLEESVMLQILRSLPDDERTFDNNHRLKTLLTMPDTPISSKLSGYLLSTLRKDQDNYEIPVNDRVIAQVLSENLHISFENASLFNNKIVFNTDTARQTLPEELIENEAINQIAVSIFNKLSSSLKPHFLLGIFEGLATFNELGSIAVHGDFAQIFAQGISELCNIEPDERDNKQVNYNSYDKIIAITDCLYRTADLMTVQREKYITACKLNGNLDAHRAEIMQQTAAEQCNAVLPPNICDNPQSAFQLLDHYMHSIQTYRSLLESDMPAEDARFALPQGSLTNLIMTVNLRSLLHIAGLRLCTMAQWEIRQLFKLIRKELMKADPFFGRLLAPKCVAMGYCDEKRNEDEHCSIRPHKKNVLKAIEGVNNKINAED